MQKEDVRSLIEKTGVVPVIRASSPQEAQFAVEAVWHGGIPIVEITMTVPGAIEVISELVRTTPNVVVGAGTVLDVKIAKECVEAGAEIIVTPGFDAETTTFVRQTEKLVIAGALTPTEIMAAWKEGADLVKGYPCSNLGGPNYIRALRGPLPQIPLVPTGGVSLDSAADYIRAGATALGVGGELILKEALQSRKAETIRDLARKFVETVKQARHSRDI